GPQLPRPARVENGRRLERPQRLEVEVQVPSVLVEECELAAFELRRRVLAAEEPVARKLDRELDRLASARVAQQQGVRPFIATRAMEPLDAAAFDPQRRLG